MTDNLKLITLRHPKSNENFIMRKKKVPGFIERNSKTWAKYGMDPGEFYTETAWVVDIEILEGVKISLPEFFV